MRVEPPRPTGGNADSNAPSHLHFARMNIVIASVIARTYVRMRATTRATVIYVRSRRGKNPSRTDAEFIPRRCHYTSHFYRSRAGAPGFSVEIKSFGVVAAEKRR